MRKQILLLLVFGLISVSLFSQDIIIRRNGDEIKSKVLEIYTNAIKYKDFDFQDGPIKNIKISDVFMIIYENGKREKFTTTETQTKIKSTNNNETNLYKKANYFSIASGYGVSYGGLGFKFQYVKTDNLKVGIHCGVGYCPWWYGILYSGGAQFYFLDYMYVDAQIGFCEALGYNIEENLWEQSLLIGYDWYLTDHFGFNFGIGASSDIGNYGLDLLWSIDSGFIFRF